MTMSLENCISTPLDVGSQFESYHSLENAINEYEKAYNVTFWKREARTILTMSRKVTRIDTKGAETLKYYSIKYACTFGGRIHRRRETTGTRNSSTIKQGCPAYIKVLLSSDQKCLKIVGVNADHNHILSERLNKSLPKHRRLDEAEKDRVKELLSLHQRKKNRKTILQQVIQETGKEVTFKDLSNVAKNQGKKPSIPKENYFQKDDSLSQVLPVYELVSSQPLESSQYFQTPVAVEVVVESDPTTSSPHIVVPSICQNTSTRKPTSVPSSINQKSLDISMTVFERERLKIKKEKLAIEKKKLDVFQQAVNELKQLNKKFDVLLEKKMVK